MIIKYSDIVAEVKKSKRDLLIYGTFLIIAGGIITIIIDGGTPSGVIAVTVICAVLIVMLFINYMTVDKRLKKMWKNVGSPDISTISNMIGNAVRLDDKSDLVLLTNDMVLNFEEFRAYRLSDITSLFKTVYTDEDVVISYVVGVLVSNYPFERDELPFKQEADRDRAFAMIAEALRRSGSTAKIT